MLCPNEIEEEGTEKNNNLDKHNYAVEIVGLIGRAKQGTTGNKLYNGKRQKLYFLKQIDDNPYSRHI